MGIPRSQMVLSAALLLGCVARPRPENQRMQLGADVLVTGSAPSIYNDSIGGDAIMAGGDINYGGKTGGDFVAAGGSQDIRGRVHGSLRAAGGSVTVRGSVDRNATIGAGDIELDSTAQVGGNVYLIGGKMRIVGAVNGGLLALGSSVELNGKISQDVEVAGDELTIGPRAVIGGNLRYRTRTKAHIDPAAKITGQVIALPFTDRPGPFTWLWRIGLFLMAVIVILLAPRFISRATDDLVRRPIRVIVVGLIVGFGGLIAIMLAGVTVVGLPLALLAAALYGVLVALSEIPVAVWLGSRIMHARTLLGRQGPLINFVVGALILVVVESIPLLGPVTRVIVSSFGFGALVLAAWSSRRPAAAA